MAINFLEKIKSIRDNLELQLHLLVHFNRVGDKYKKYLISNLDGEHQIIDEKLATTGSVFLPEFADDPLELVNNLVIGLEQYPYEVTKDESIPDLMLLFPREEYPDGIGLDGILNIEDIEEDDLGAIEQTKRGDFDVNVLEREMVRTWQLNVIFGEDEEGTVDIQTVFPGKYAPPFPDEENQDEETYISSKDFWDHHVFLDSPDDDQSN